MKAMIQVSKITDEAVSFIHQAIDNAVRNGVRICITLSPEEDDKPQFPRNRDFTTDDRPTITKPMLKKPFHSPGAA